jgi:hypothetical protein
MKGLKTDLIGYNVMNNFQLVEVVNHIGEMIQSIEKRSVVGTMEVVLSSGRKMEVSFSVTLEEGRCYVQANALPLRDMTSDEFREYGQILQQIQEKGNEVKADLEATK